MYQGKINVSKTIKFKVKRTLDDCFIFEKSNSHRENIILNYYASHNIVLDCRYKAKTIGNWWENNGIPVIMDGISHVSQSWQVKEAKKMGEEVKNPNRLVNQT